MLKFEHKDGAITVFSDYDSGKHLGFQVVYVEDGCYSGKSLDDLLTREQIRLLENTLGSLTKHFLEENES